MIELGALSRRCRPAVRWLAVVALTMSAWIGTAAPVAAAPVDGRVLPADSRFYVQPDSLAALQALTDLRDGHLQDALTMAKLASYPESSWFGSGTPTEVQTGVERVERAAARQRAVPILVAYNIPGRDCSLYSGGGAASDAAYRDWIAGFARGIGAARTVVVLEPDALANLPSDCGQDPDGTVTPGRLADLNYAVQVLEAQPRTLVYLDAGNSSWQAVGTIAERLVAAGVAQAQGFSLDVSNFHATSETNEYGGWVSRCIWFATHGPAWGAGHFNYCASQYFSSSAPNDGKPGNKVVGSDPTTWHWTDLWYQQNTAAAPQELLSHFVADTSRNGQGSWKPSVPPGPGDAQTWCNPPDRGVGLRPTADTGVPQLDAYLWVKTIGASDGTCTRGLPAGSPDPVYGAVDPVAGAWWPAQALTLARNANPTLTFAWQH